MIAVTARWRADPQFRCIVHALGVPRVQAIVIGSHRNLGFRPLCVNRFRQLRTRNAFRPLSLGRAVTSRRWRSPSQRGGLRVSKWSVWGVLTGKQDLVVRETYCLAGSHRSSKFKVTLPSSESECGFEAGVRLSQPQHGVQGVRRCCPACQCCGRNSATLSIEEHGATYLIKGTKEHLIPFIDAFVGKVDVAAGKIEVDWGEDY